MTRITVSEARGGLADAINRVAYRGERIVIDRRGKGVAVLVPIDDLKLLEQIEDRLDIRDARRAMKEEGEVPWDKLKAELGL